MVVEEYGSRRTSRGFYCWDSQVRSIESVVKNGNKSIRSSGRFRLLGANLRILEVRSRHSKINETIVLVNASIKDKK